MAEGLTLGPGPRFRCERVESGVNSAKTPAHGARRHCEERSDKAIQRPQLDSGLLRIRLAMTPPFRWALNNGPVSAYDARKPKKFSGQIEFCKLLTEPKQVEADGGHEMEEEPPGEKRLSCDAERSARKHLAG
jgi:hypothetical protein